MPLPALRAALPLISLLPACTMSDLAPDADVSITGLVLDDGGAPIPEHPVALMKQADLGDVITGVTLGPITVLTCLGDDPPDICSRASIQRTEGDGRFAFAMKGRDTQGSLGQAKDFTLMTDREPRDTQITGAGAIIGFLVQEEQLAIPTVQLWDPDLQLSSSAEQTAVALSAPPQGDLYLHFETGDRYAPPIWELPAGETTEVDSRVLEDANATVVAVNRYQIENAAGRFSVERRSGAYPAASGRGAPPSRGASCSATFGDGSTAELLPCPLTDGELALGYAREYDQPCDDEDDACHEARRIRAIRIDLGAPRSIELIVARASVYGLSRVEISVDQIDWQLTGGADRGGFARPLPPGTTARYVRLIADAEAGGLEGARELSVW